MDVETTLLAKERKARTARTRAEMCILWTDDPRRAKTTGEQRSGPFEGFEDFQMRFKQLP